MISQVFGRIHRLVELGMGCEDDEDEEEEELPELEGEGDDNVENQMEQVD